MIVVTLTGNRWTWALIAACGRALVRLRRMEKHHRDEAEALLDAYKAALGMPAGTPLGDYALGRAA